MQPSTTQTLTVNAIGAKSPTTVRQAGAVTMRILVRNVGAGMLFLAFATEDVNPQQGPTTGTYRLPAGQEDVFVLAPKESLFALAIGAGGSISVTASEALPLEYLKS